jgi:hypothetical protein
MRLDGIYRSSSNHQLPVPSMFLPRLNHTRAGVSTQRDSIDVTWQSQDSLNNPPGRRQAALPFNASALGTRVASPHLEKLRDTGLEPLSYNVVLTHSRNEVLQPFHGVILRLVSILLLVLLAICAILFGTYRPQTEYFHCTFFSDMVSRYARCRHCVRMGGSAPWNFVNVVTLWFYKICSSCSNVNKTWKQTKTFHGRAPPAVRAPFQRILEYGHSPDRGIASW